MSLVYRGTDDGYTVEIEEFNDVPSESLIYIDVTKQQSLDHIWNVRSFTKGTPPIIRTYEILPVPEGEREHPMFTGPIPVVREHGFPFPEHVKSIIEETINVYCLLTYLEFPPKRVIWEDTRQGT